jgi:hypothetical protein
VKRHGFVALLRTLPARLALLPILLYRRVISPLTGPRCKYYPSCSTYAEQAVRELGAGRGAVLALWRLARCNPWSHGGVDELADRPLFRDAPTRSGRPAATPGAEDREAVA